jgi:outer membrane protein TolC
MLKSIIIISFLCIITDGYAFTFKQATDQIGEHDYLKSLEYRYKELEAKSEVSNSWGDPILKVAAKNIPKNSMKDDETGMSGIEFGISQKISLTTKHGHLGDAIREESKSVKYLKEDKRQSLLKEFWKILISMKRLNKEIILFKENLSWLNKTIKVSKKLYSNGKISQQGLLDIKIRHAQMQSLLDNKNFEIESLNAKLSYLFKNKSKFKLSSVPWSIVNKKTKTNIDLKKLALKSKLRASEHNLSASNLNYIPDVTFSLGYTKRSSFDELGDFVSASISFPIPSSDKKYANKDMAINQKYSATHNLNNYNLLKSRDIKILNINIKKIRNELKILETRALKFAESSRKITLKSYSLGEATYVELLQSEIKLQTILVKQVELKSLLLMKHIDLKYTVGEKLDV